MNPESPSQGAAPSLPPIRLIEGDQVVMVAPMQNPMIRISFCSIPSRCRRFPVPWPTGC